VARRYPGRSAGGEPSVEHRRRNASFGAAFPRTSAFNNGGLDRHTPGRRWHDIPLRGWGAIRWRTNLDQARSSAAVTRFSVRSNARRRAGSLIFHIDLVATTPSALSQGMARLLPPRRRGTDSGWCRCDSPGRMGLPKGIPRGQRRFWPGLGTDNPPWAAPVADHARQKAAASSKGLACPEAGAGGGRRKIAARRCCYLASDQARLVPGHGASQSMEAVLSITGPDQPGVHPGSHCWTAEENRIPIAPGGMARSGRVSAWESRGVW